MITEYIDQALSRARYEELEDGSYCVTVRGLRGVMALGPSIEPCRKELSEVVEEWILVRIARGLDVPKLGGVSIRVRRASCSAPVRPDSVPGADLVPAQARSERHLPGGKHEHFAELASPRSFSAGRPFEFPPCRDDSGTSDQPKAQLAFSREPNLHSAGEKD